MIQELLWNGESRKLILASGSPRRQEILAGLGLSFEVCLSKDFVEVCEGMAPEKLACFNALGKVSEVAKNFNGNEIVIGADTVVVSGDLILGKPKDHDDALRILKMINGTEHKVISGVVVFDVASGKHFEGFETTYVKMAKMSGFEIEKYLDSGEGDDKAGAYAIQGLGSLWIEEIKGDYFNVVGMPVRLTYELLKKMPEL